MTREEAIRILKDSKAKISPHDLSFHVVEHEKNEALDMAIKALEQEPCEDAISRAEVIDELNRIGRNAFKEDTDYDNFFAFLDNLPPVTPQPEKVCVANVHFDEEKLKEICKNATLTILDNSNAPTIEPKTGHWISVNTGKQIHLKDGMTVESVKCSECDEWLTASDEYACNGNYCPNCGARMVEPQESER